MEKEINKWKELVLEALELRSREQELVEKIGKIKRQYIIEIWSAVDDKGKALYKNETLREQELYTRLDADKEYQEARQKLTETQQERKEKEVEAKALEYTIKWRLAIAKQGAEDEHI